jgi:hypothetical protein
MAKYKLNLSFDIDITADEDEEVSEIVEMLQNLYYDDRKEFLDSLRYYFEEEKVAYHITINPQKVYLDD